MMYMSQFFFLPCCCFTVWLLASYCGYSYPLSWWCAASTAKRNASQRNGRTERGGSALLAPPPVRHGRKRKPILI